MMLGLLQARMSSSRLPGKVMKPLAGEPMLYRQVQRLQRCERIDLLVVATSDHPSDDPIAALCQSRGIECFRGNLDDVLDRFFRAASSYRADHVVRLTGDCPLIDPGMVDRLIELYLSGGYDYASNSLEPTFPDGLDAEVLSFGALEIAHREAEFPADREHVTRFIHRRPERFRIGVLKNDQDLSALRWTVDEPEDYQFVSEVYDRLYPSNSEFGMADILQLLSREPSIAEVNSMHKRNAGGARYSKSKSLLSRALRTIPCGSQTFSKSHLVYPSNAAPLFIERGKGSRVWDVDGNEYVDYVSSLLAVTLGYCDPDVDAAVRAQLERGVSFSLPTRLEMELAERLSALIPCAEQSRFGKNGSDATSAAIRIARAHTGRDRVAVCGYHGWQDWYIGATARRKGVPAAVQSLTRSFTYNDLGSLERLLAEHPDGYAAVVLEPMNFDAPLEGFLEGVRDLAHQNGALLIFDEIITGFRFDLGGAQRLFGVIPDLAAFGKGMANGFPISAVVGRAEYMRQMDEIFFSGTFGGETLSLVAALATIDKMSNEPVLPSIHRTGARIQMETTGRLKRAGLESAIVIGGHAAWPILQFRDIVRPDGTRLTGWEIKSLFLQEMLARGVLQAGSYNVSYAHGPEDLDRLFLAQDAALGIVRDAVDRGDLRSRLSGPPMEPIFKVR